jgi:hypothetical protein
MRARNKRQSIAINVRNISNTSEKLLTAVAKSPITAIKRGGKKYLC